MGKFGLLGERLGHSYSPKIHAMLADYEYALHEKKPDEVEAFLKSGVFDGLNVTMPYKRAVIPFCTELSAAVSITGNVNTIIRRGDGALFGDNTDYHGFSYLLCKAGVDVKGKKVIVLGSGGASATVRAVANAGEARAVVTISRCGADSYGNLAKHYDAQIVVNATPVGMYPDNGRAPIELRRFQVCEAVLDLVSNPLKTELLLQAEDMGISCIGGLHMLVSQAAHASALFANAGCECVVDAALIDSVAEAILHKVRNIAIIGMPGCGKTTVGRQLALATDRKFFDTDELVVQKAGKSVEAIFTDDGESAFRKLEEDVLRELSKESECVIATGGGAVKREANHRLLRQNSVIVFLDRAIESLPVEGRPISLLQGAAKIAEERLPIYNSWCDHKITACADSDKTVQTVKGLLKL
ncbi:MAG: shikimate kinase [Oscillospiraceae bacterium]|nr:shikimate kinase [Oscillospiraceae bacterium]